MSYRHTDPLNLARAAKLLQHLRGQLVDVTGTEMEIFRTSASAQEHWQLSKAAGVHVYREGDSWHADCPTSAPVGQIEGLHERRMAGSS